LRFRFAKKGNIEKYYIVETFEDRTEKDINKADDRTDAGFETFIKTTQDKFTLTTLEDIIETTQKDIFNKAIEDTFYLAFKEAFIKATDRFIAKTFC
jgi:hypothetical protein